MGQESCTPNNTEFVHHIIVYLSGALGNVTEGTSSECFGRASEQPISECMHVDGGQELVDGPLEERYAHSNTKVTIIYHLYYTTCLYMCSNLIAHLFTVCHSTIVIHNCLLGK